MPEFVNKTLCHYTQGQWRPLEGLFFERRPNAKALRWLCLNESLTAHLIHTCSHQFRLQLIAQTWATPRLSERRLLQLPERANALIRCVKLYDGDQLLVWARTVIPGNAARGALRPLTLLGTEPLGARIFQDPGLLRHSLEICASPKGMGSESEGYAKWGRRSIYRSLGEAFLVYEFFHESVFKR